MYTMVEQILIRGPILLDTPRGEVADSTMASFKMMFTAHDLPQMCARWNGSRLDEMSDEELMSCLYVPVCSTSGSSYVERLPLKLFHKDVLDGMELLKTFDYLPSD